jgi:hypothetical protein
MTGISSASAETAIIRQWGCPGNVAKLSLLYGDGTMFEYVVESRHLHISYKVAYLPLESASKNGKAVFLAAIIAQPNRILPRVEVSIHCDGPFNPINIDIPNTTPYRVKYGSSFKQVDDTHATAIMDSPWSPDSYLILWISSERDKNLGNCSITQGI